MKVYPHKNIVWVDEQPLQHWPYVRQNGVWVLANTHVRVNGKWIEIPNWEKFTSFKPGASNMKASSTYSSSAHDYSVSKLVDGKTVAAGGSWASKANVSFAYIQIDFLYPVRNLVVYMQNRQKSTGEYPLVNGPEAGRIEGSDDGSTWVTLCTISRGGNTGSSGATTTHSCNNSNDAYRYVRLYFTDWAGKSYDYDNYCALGEIWFDGEFCRTSGVAT